MKDVCYSCHSLNYVNNFYKQYDAGIKLYNEKFARPAEEIMNTLLAAKVIDPNPLNEDIEWTYYFLWHQDGRKVRNGLAMMGPNYVQWEGFKNLTKRFYLDFISEAERLLPGVTKEIMARPEHKWFWEKMSLEEREEMNQYHKRRYISNQE
jgi:hypothetical protein